MEMLNETQRYMFAKWMIKIKDMDTCVMKKKCSVLKVKIQITIQSIKLVAKTVEDLFSSITGKIMIQY